MNIRPMLTRANHTVIVQSPTPATSPTGGRKSSGWGDTKTLTPVWVQPASAQLVKQYGERQLVVSHAVYTDADPACGSEDRLKFGERFLRVVGVTQPGELGVFWRIDCMELRA